MTWSTPRTWAAGEKPTAAELNQEIRDDLNAIVPIGPNGWTAYTPTLTQSSTVTKTVTYAKYMKVGRMVHVTALLTVTGSGAANNAILVGLPFTAAASGLVAGTFRVNNSSGPNDFVGGCYFSSTTVVAGMTNNNSHLLGAASSAFASGLGAGDLVCIDLTYEATS